MKKPRVIYGSRTYEVLDLLRDGKPHRTNELPLPPKTREWPSSQWEDRHRWFTRAWSRGLIENVGEPYSPLWKITELGKQVLEESEKR